MRELFELANEKNILHYPLFYKKDTVKYTHLQQKVSNFSVDGTQIIDFEKATLFISSLSLRNVCQIQIFIFPQKILI